MNPRRFLFLALLATLLLCLAPLHAADVAESGDATPKPPPTLIGYLGKYHLLAIHLPIALILVATLAESLYWITPKRTFRDVAIFNLRCALLFALLAGLLGWMLGGTHHLFGKEWGSIKSWHRWLGTLVPLVTGAALWLQLRAERGRSPLPYRLTLIAAALLVSVAAHFGGMLSNGSDYLDWGVDL